MMIKTVDGTEHVASQSQANANSILGGVGTFLGLLNGGANMMGFGPGRGGYGGYGRGDYGDYPNHMYQHGPDSRYVTKAELNLVQELQGKDIVIARKDSELALKESENYTEKLVNQKLVEVYANLEKQNQRQDEKTEALRREFDHFRCGQMEWNATATGQFSNIQDQVRALRSVTRIYIPQSRICENGCDGCGNS